MHHPSSRKCREERELPSRAGRRRIRRGELGIRAYGSAAEEAVVHGEVAPQPAHELRMGYLAERPRPLASS